MKEYGTILEGTFEGDFKNNIVWLDHKCLFLTAWILLSFEFHSFSFLQAYVLSSHRLYVTKVDTFELSDTICGKGEAVTIFLFNDSMEVCNYRKLCQF